MVFCCCRPTDAFGVFRDALLNASWLEPVVIGVIFTFPSAQSSLVSGINEVLSPRELLLTGYFCFMIIICKP